MKRTDLAYIAGIVDGEGWISLRSLFSWPPFGRTYRVEMGVKNTNIWLIQWLRLAFGGDIYEGKSGRKENWKPAYSWILRSMAALEFLKLVYPYLRLKKPQAEIAIKFLEMRGRKGRMLTDKEKAIAEAQSIVMANLNKRGR